MRERGNEGERVREREGRVSGKQESWGGEMGSLGKRMAIRYVLIGIEAC